MYRLIASVCLMVCLCVGCESQPKQIPVPEAKPNADRLDRDLGKIGEALATGETAAKKNANTLTR